MLPFIEKFCNQIHHQNWTQRLQLNRLCFKSFWSSGCPVLFYFIIKVSMEDGCNFLTSYLRLIVTIFWYKNIIDFGCRVSGTHDRCFKQYVQLQLYLKEGSVAHRRNYRKEGRRRWIVLGICKKVAMPLLASIEIERPAFVPGEFKTAVSVHRETKGTRR